MFFFKKRTKKYYIGRTAFSQNIVLIGFQKCKSFEHKLII